MNNQILQGKTGIIFGALDEQSIAWKVADLCAREGARFTLTNAPSAIRFGQINELAKKHNTEVIPADATNMYDLDNLFKRSMEVLEGPVDFVLHSIGMGMNVRKNIPYTDINYDFFLRTLDISALSFHRILQTAMKLDAIKKWGSVLALTYIAAQRTFPGYHEMAEAKALLESIARSFGYHYGRMKKVRINTISQSPTITTAGSKVQGFNAFIRFADKMSPLGNADAEDCARYCVMMFSDYTRKVTMQNLYHDGGFSSVGFSEDLMDFLKK